MKTILIIFILTITIYPTWSQKVEGTYSNKWESSSGEAVEYKLTIHKNGTFTFYATRKHLENSLYKTEMAEGSWKYENHLLTLDTRSDDHSNELAKNLNANLARYIDISPRNPKYKSLKPSFKFYKSNVFYSKDMELFKIKTEATLAN